MSEIIINNNNNIIPWKQRKNDYFKEYMRNYFKVIDICDICEKEIPRPSFRRHLRSKKHMKKINEKN